MKKLSILVPHYGETFEEVKPLLDSVAFQQNIDFSKIEVVICDDGPDAVDLTEHLKGYEYDIKYLRCTKGGVSKQRNNAFDSSTGEYVAWCDADDQYYHCLAFWLIFNEMAVSNPDGSIGFKALISTFLEESRHPETKQTLFLDRQQDMTFVHGKVFNRKFLVDNHIRFFDNLTIHEDNVLMAQVQAVTKEIKYCPVPFYLWKWRDNSICRRDKKYILKTLNNMIDSHTEVIEWCKKYNHLNVVTERVIFAVYDLYYTMSTKEWIDQENKEYRAKTERHFADFYRTYKTVFTKADEQMKMMVSNGVRQRCVMEGRLVQEEVTLSKWLEYIESLV